MTVLWWLLAAYAVGITWQTYGRGPFALTYNPYVAWLVRRLKVVAVTVGARGYLALPFSAWTAAQLQELYDHESEHGRQYRTWGFLFLPVYWLLLAIHGYDKHPWEQRARRAAGESER